jgi:hypothetical protein
MLDVLKVMLWVVAIVILPSIVMLKICCFTTCFSVGLICNIVNVTYVVVPYLKLFTSITLVAGLVDMSHQNYVIVPFLGVKEGFPKSGIKTLLCLELFLYPIVYVVCRLM